MVSETEHTKDTLQVVAESAAEHFGNIATIVATAARDIARELGALVNEVMEERETAQRARQDAGSP